MKNVFARSAPMNSAMKTAGALARGLSLAGVIVFSLPSAAANEGLDQPGYRCTALQVMGGSSMPAYGDVQPTLEEAQESAMNACRLMSRWGGTCLVQNCWHHD